MMVPSLAFVWRNAPGISTTAISRSSIASITAVVNIDSIHAVGDDVSSLDLYSRYGCLSANPLPLIVPLRLFFRNMRHPRAIFLICAMISSGNSGLSTSQSWNYFISLTIDSTISCPHMFIPAFMPNWVRSRCSAACCIAVFTLQYVTSKLTYAVWACRKEVTVVV